MKIEEGKYLKISSQIYSFFREEGWYPVELMNDEDALENVKYNPGTVRVERITGEIVWQAPEVRS
jgi:hypothetical protein